MLHLHPTHALAGQCSVPAWTTECGAHNKVHYSKLCWVKETTETSLKPDLTKMWDSFLNIQDTKSPW